jgi:hypothetical protein
MMNDQQLRTIERNLKACVLMLSLTALGLFWLVLRRYGVI